MIKRQWNPRYVAYANAHGRSPEDMLRVDKVKYPGGKMAGFIIWSSEQVHGFKTVHPGAFIGDSLADHGAYDAWLAARYPSTKETA